MVSNVDELITNITPIIAKLSTLQCYILSFIPEDINDRIKKGLEGDPKAGAGVHIYIIYDPKDIKSDKWNEITKYLSETLGESFDEEPWKTPCINLPFVIKATHPLITTSIYHLLSFNY